MRSRHGVPTIVVRASPMVSMSEERLVGTYPWQNGYCSDVGGCGVV